MYSLYIQVCVSLLAITKDVTTNHTSSYEIKIIA